MENNDKHRLITYCQRCLALVGGCNGSPYGDNDENKDTGCDGFMFSERLIR